MVNTEETVCKFCGVKRMTPCMTEKDVLATADSESLGFKECKREAKKITTPDGRE